MTSLRHTSIRTALDDATAQFAAAGVPDPRVDAELILCHVLGIGRGALQARLVTGGDLPDDAAAPVEDAVRRRALREPLQHITGVAPFRSLELAVGPGVFVPRPETETVAQLAIDALRATASATPVGVDLGTGSGAIALSMATEVPHSTVYGVEVSPDAYSWATENARRAGAANARLVFGDLASALNDLDGTVDVVVSNPPYIPLGMVPRDPEVRLFDPEPALYGGVDGMDVVRSVSRTGHRLLRVGGVLIIEHGETQGGDIRSLLIGDGWRATATHHDLTGRDRVTTALR